jgi:hypothetical protein
MPKILTQQDFDNMPPEQLQEIVSHFQKTIPQDNGMQQSQQPQRSGFLNSAKNFGQGLVKALPYVLNNKMPPQAGEMNDLQKMQLQNDMLLNRAKIITDYRDTVKDDSNAEQVPVYGYDVHGKYGMLKNEDGTPITQPKGAKSANMPFGVANIKLAEEAVPGIQKAYESGDVVPYQGSSQQARTIVGGKMGSEGKRMDTEALTYKGEQSLLKNASTEDAKVNTGIKLMDLIDSATDKTTGEIKIPPSMHVEVALGVAKMISPTGVVPIQLEEELRQGTLQENAAKLAIFLGADPKEIGGTTQSVAQFFKKTIDRLSRRSEEQRDKYLNGEKSSYSNRQPLQTSSTNVNTNQLNDAEARYQRYLQISGGQ